ncbi:MBL fold metallo-hydrolase [Clostridium estertheticum]|uniref:MBL fold metallo-hydrolase n=1 Tax=Clostridium estertheticum TaxID=238834 RepID=UPI001C0B3234|nr:MBL fold metallo-hydrolase [Clostridium estertheticum]MBU3214817.1 MBL fold metallo-hydrolase [Clostridium estertheticum]WAG57225.1 MBL fold metallo-hydrolase [Clostridium estertheticum]
MLGKSIKRLLAISLINVSIFAMGGCATSQPAKVADTASKPAATATPATKSTGNAPSVILDTTAIAPTKVFDKLYFIGTKGTGVWLLNTTDGLILIDSMNDTADAKNIIVPGIKALGFDPADIKYVLVTHGHCDHYGGAKYIQDTYGSKVLLTTVDWDLMNKNFTDKAAGKPGMPAPPLPTSYSAITDGQKLTLGDTTITIVSTPGHTPGGVSLIIPVTDNGTKHTVAMWGGTGLPQSLADNKAYLSSLDYFAKFTDAAKVDAEITAHSTVDNGAARMETLTTRKTGDLNPFVIGQDAYKVYMDKMKTTVNTNIEKLSKK